MRYYLSLKLLQTGESSWQEAIVWQLLSGICFLNPLSGEKYLKLVCQKSAWTKYVQTHPANGILWVRYLFEKQVVFFSFGLILLVVKCSVKRETKDAIKRAPFIQTA